MPVFFFPFFWVGIGIGGGDVSPRALYKLEPPLHCATVLPCRVLLLLLVVVVLLVVSVLLNTGKSVKFFVHGHYRYDGDELLSIECYECYRPTSVFFPSF